MAQQNDKNYQDGKEEGSFNDDSKNDFAYNFEEEEQLGNEEENPVTKIYVAGNEYNSVDEIPPDVRDKMSETLLHVQQESSNAEDLSIAFKKQRKLRTGGLLFGDRADHYSKPTLDFGKIALVVLGIAILAIVIYIMALK